jgi:hypothetical protein
MIVAFAFSLLESNACSCIETEIDEAVTSAHAIFIGEVLGIQPVLMVNDTGHYRWERGYINRKKGNLDTLNLTPIDRIFNHFAFRIVRVFKGIAVESDTVLISASSPYVFSSCDMSFSPGEKYIVYAYNKDSASTINYRTTSRTAIPYKLFSTGLCTRTKKENADEISGIENALAAQPSFWDSILNFFKNLF